jgi:hypothetical protein
MALDAIAQIRLFVKLKLKKCARPGNRAGFFAFGAVRRSRAAAWSRKSSTHAARCVQIKLSHTVKQRSEHMPFEKGQSGNPGGRPPGARNKATVIAELLLQGEAEAMMRSAIERAKAGDMAALRMCLDRLVPPCRHRTVAFELPPLTSARDAASALAAITAGVAAGELTPAEAGELSRLVDGYVRVLETTVLEQRVAKVERESSTPVPRNDPGRQSDQGDQSNQPNRSNSRPLYNFGDAP